MTKRAIAKTFCSLSLLATVGAMSGCDIAATPGYSGQERFRMIGQGWSYDYQQLADDTDEALLLRPASRLTIWNEYHRSGV